VDLRSRRKPTTSDAEVGRLAAKRSEYPSDDYRKTTEQAVQITSTKYMTKISHNTDPDSATQQLWSQPVLTTSSDSTHPRQCYYYYYNNLAPLTAGELLSSLTAFVPLLVSKITVKQ